MRRALLVVLAVAVAGAALFLLRGSPAPSWAVASHEGSRVEQAWASAAAYGHTVTSQTNPSACGPTSLSNVWRSADAGAFESPCTFGFCMGGLTLDALAAAAQHPGWKVTVLRDLTLEQFREELTHVAEPSRRYVINFHRGPIFGAGGGHHSPIGAVVGDDVFVLDVNAHYGPWLVASAKLFEAMDTVDASSGKKRGLIRIELW